eukprot:m.166670 g.166670  ORF g.166670 m.166670 type:complete len:1274 (+) comp13455_c0_seq1:190-4011(+)
MDWISNSNTKNMMLTPFKADDPLVFSMNKILVKEEIAPKEKHVVSFLSAVSNHEDVFRFFTSLVKQKGMKDNYIIVWKALGLCHKLIHAGNDKVFNTIVEKHGDTFDYFRRMCVHETSLYAKSAAVLVQLLIAKVSFHKKFRDFLGNMTSTTSPQVLVEKHGSAVLGAILELMQLNIVCASVVLSMADTVNAASSFLSTRRSRKRNHDIQKQTCLLWPLVCVTQELVSLYEISVRVIDHISRSSDDPSIDSMYRLFSAQHRKVFHVFEDARRVPFLASKLYTLSLAKTPPKLVKGEAFEVPPRINPLPLEPEVSVASKSMSLSPMPRRKRATTTSTASSTASSLSSSRKTSLTPAELQHDYNVQRALVASLREEVKKLRGGLTDVDADAVASIQMDGIRMGRKDVLALRQEKEETENALDEALDELGEVRAAMRTLEQTMDDNLITKAEAIAELEQRIAMYEQEIQSLHAHMDTMVNVMEDKNKEQEEVRAQCTSLESENALLNAKVVEVTMQLSEKKEEAVAAKEAKAAKDEEHNSIENEYTLLKQTHEAVQEELASANSNVTALEEEKEILTSRILQLKEEAEGDSKERRELEETISSAERKAEMVSEQLLQTMERELEAKTALQEANSQNDNLGIKMASLKACEEQLEGEVAQLKSTVDVLHTQISDTKVDANTRTQKLEALLEQSQAKLVDATAQDEVASNEISKLHSEAAEFRKTIRTLEDNLDTKTQMLSTNEVALVGVQEERNNLREKVSELDTQVKTITSARRDEVAALTVEVNKVKQETERAERNHTVVKEKLERKVEAMAKKERSTKEEAVKAITAFEKKVESLQNELSTRTGELQGKVQHAQEQLAAHKTISQAQIDTLKDEKKRALESQMNTFNSSLQSILSKNCTAHVLTINEQLDAILDTVQPLQQRNRQGSFDELRDSLWHEKAVQLRMAVEVLFGCLLQSILTNEDRSAVETSYDELHPSMSLLLTNMISGSKGEEFALAKENVSRIVHELKEMNMEMERSSEQNANNLHLQLNNASETVSNAVSRIKSLLSTAKESLEERTLNVNESILQESMSLMRLIQKLVSSSSDLQQEIVQHETAQGKKTSVAQFYKRNSRWVDGLVSAARAVGGAATVLVDTADRAFSGHGKFEEIMVCGQEITASTAQLVSASRVKAKQGSEMKAVLEQLSKEVYTATQSLIEAVRTACQKANEAQSAQDYLSLTLTQARRLQMDSQVRVKELEYALLKEQERLRQIRKAQYKLAEEHPVTKKRMSVSDA